MKRNPSLWIAAAAIVLALPVWHFLSRHPGEFPLPRLPDAENDALSAEAERIRKLSIAQTDILMTGQLCRMQCRRDLAAAARQLAENGGGAPPGEALKRLHAEKKHFLATAYVREGREMLTFGEPPRDDSGIPGAAVHWRRAVQAAANGGSYMSRALKGTDGYTYFILGEPAGSSAGAVAFIRQDLLQRVGNHQIRNLRLTEFPEDRRFGIRAVNPETGEEEDVDSPEDNEGISHYRNNEVVVRFRTPPSQEDLARMMKETDSTLLHQLHEVYIFASGSRSTRELLDYFRNQAIEYAEPHYMYVSNGQADAGTVSPNDELYLRYQWNLPAISVPAGWTVSKGTEDVIVAVIDTGADLDHPDLSGRLTEGYNTIEPGASPQDDVGHGTHVAGVISALTDNGQGIAGMTWHNRVMPVKSLDSTGMGSTYSVAKGIIWAVDHGAKVINLSLGNYAGASFLHDAIKYAYERDVVLIAAAGNDHTEQPGYPAAYPEVLAVSATDRFRRLAAFSNYGDYIDVAAPGEHIASTYADGQYAALSGTSMASPHAAALAALMRSANPALTNAQVYDIIRRSALDLGPRGRDSHFGYGQIDAARALRMATGKDGLQEAAAEAPEQKIGGASLLEQLLRAIFGMAQ